MITSEIVMAEIANLVGQPGTKVDINSDLTELITDSIDLVELILGLQERFNVKLVHEDLKNVDSLAKLSALVVSHAAPERSPGGNHIVPIQRGAGTNFISGRRGRSRATCLSKG